jgi:hypothetical protein
MQQDVVNSSNEGGDASIGSAAPTVYPEATKGVGAGSVVVSSSAESGSGAGVFSASPPAPPASTGLQSETNRDLPVPVVQVLSVRGVEYTMMTLTLWIVAAALIWILLSKLNGITGFSLLIFPTSLLIVCVPVFSLLFLRLRKAEVKNPALRLDASKRRLSQFTQVIAFATCLFNLIGFVYLVLSKVSGEAAPSIGKSLVNLLVVLVVAGGILAYYWFDEHRTYKG